MSRGTIPESLAACLALLVASCDKDPSYSVKQAGPAEDLAALPAVSMIPLAAASSTESDRLFRKVPPAESGIDFVHSWQPRTPYESQLLKTGFTGGGVCLGDYDRDGLCDIFLTRPHGGPVLYRNVGDFKFQDATLSAGLQFPDSITGGCTMADVNGDGWLDIYVCTYGADNLLFISKRDGTFRVATGAALPNHTGASVKTVFADYDRDGDLDAFIVTNRHEPVGNPKIKYLGEQGNYSVAAEHQELVGVINLPDRQQFVKGAGFDHLFRNDISETGSLGWTNVTKSAGIAGNFHGLDAVWWDYNGDHFPDLYIANDFTDPDQFLRNNGDGTFTDISLEALPHTPWFAMGAACADFNGDGLPDLLTTDMSATTHYREKISMGAMDAIAWFLDWSVPRQYMRNALYLNSGTERFLEAAHMSGLASSNWTWSVKAADFDCDGREDVFFTNGFPRDYNNSDFSEALRRKGNSSPDAWLDAPELREKNLVFANDGDLHFSETGDKWGLGEKGISFGAALGDLDNDGDLDLVVNHFGEAPSIMRNHTGAGQHRLRVQLVGRNGSNRHGFGARVEIELPDGAQQFRELYPGNGFMSADEPSITFGVGTAETITRLTVKWPSGKVQRLKGLKVDHAYTIAEPVQSEEDTTVPTVVPLFAPSNLLSRAIHQEREFDDFKAQPLLPNKLSQLGPTLAWGDIDGDGDTDFFLGGAAGQAGQIFVRAEDGSFKPSAAPVLEADSESEDLASLFSDVDGDSDLDLFVVSGSIENSPLRDRLYLNDGGGNFSTAPSGSLPDLEESGGCVAAVDYDHDGDIDLFVGGRCVPGAYPTTPSSRLLTNDGSGIFSDSTSSIAPDLLKAGMVTDASWSDVDGDSWEDLVVCAEFSPVQVWFNQAGEALEEKKNFGKSGWWYAVEPADIDGDGDIDLIAGNLGENTKYHPTSEHPQVLLYGDFGDTGKFSIVEAKPGEGGLLPVRGRSCSSNAMPFLKEKFKTYHKFAISSLGDIYGDKEIESSMRLTATGSESGVFINDGSGDFRFRPLPRLAQISPTRDIVTLDFNGDSKLDLFLAQNFYTPQRETGQFDGGVGLLLRGNGDGTFEAIAPHRSGIVAPWDSPFATATDLDGDGRIDLVIGTNNGPVRAFLRNR